MSAANGSNRNCTGCGLPLSRYNTDDRCHSCARSGMPPRRPDGRAGRRRRVPDYLPDEVLVRSDFRDACARQDFGMMFLIVHEYKDQGWTFSHIARRCEITNIRAYTNGGRQPDRVYVIERVSDGLHIPGDMLRISRRPWESENATSNVVETQSVSLSDAGVAPWTVDGTLLSACEASEVDSVDRRSFLFLTGTALTVPAHDWLIAHPVTDVSRSAGRAIEPKHVDSLDEIAGNLRRMDDQMGGGSLIDVVQAQAGYVIGLIRAGRYTDSTGRRLHGTLGELLRLGGWVAYDNGDQVRAQRSWIAALHAAHTAGDTALGANVLGFMAEQAYGVGKLHDAARLASTAVAGYKGSSPQVSSILRMRAARAHAMLGDTSDCRTAIDSAYDTFRNSPSEQGEPAWAYWMDEASLNEQIGKCFLYLRDYPAASRHLEMSLHSSNWQGSYVRDGVSVLIALANTHAQAGDPEQACAIAGKAVSALSGQVDSPRLIAKIKGLYENLEPYQKVSAVQELGEKIDNLCAESR